MEAVLVVEGILVVVLEEEGVVVLVEERVVVVVLIVDVVLVADVLVIVEGVIVVALVEDGVLVAEDVLFDEVEVGNLDVDVTVVVEEGQFSVLGTHSKLPFVHAQDLQGSQDSTSCPGS